MHGENLLVDDGGNRKAVEAVGEGLPELDVVPSLALIVETVYTVDGSALVVAAQDEKVFRVLDLVRQQQADGFEGLLAAVDVIAEEEVVGLRREAAILEQSQEIVVLAVDIAANLEVPRVSRNPKRIHHQHNTNLDRGLQLEKDGL